MNRINTEGMKEAGIVRPLRRAEQSSATETARAAEDGAKASTIAPDRVKVSDAAAEVGNLLDRVRQMPDVRPERVEAAREKIVSGSYERDAKRIADAILDQER